MAAPRREGSMTEADPERLGPYWLLDRIADGRLGPVFRACLRRAGKPDKLLAVTRIASGLSADPGFDQRFDALFGEVANVVHPALCAIEDVGEQGSTHYVAAELVSGRDLAHFHAALAQRGQSFPPSLVAHIANQIADGLAAAHRATRAGQLTQLCHGELGLSEILIGYDGSVRLTGLGTNALRAFVPTLARRGYRAPELERGAACDARSDVYSLGACMYELLTGTSVTHGDRHSDSAPLLRPQSHISRVIPRTLEPIIRRALADDPDTRFQSATELGRSLRRWSTAQSAPGDTRGLSAFLLTHFDAERAADETRLDTRLGRVPADPIVSRQAPRARSETPTSTRVRSISPARPAQSVSAPPAPARAATIAADPRPGADRFDDLAEHTPPRGQLMHELAATMTGVDSPIVVEEEEAPPPAAEAASVWDDATPAHGWISVSEERAARRNPGRAAPSTPAAGARSKPAPRMRSSAPAPGAAQGAQVATPIAVPPAARRTPAARGKPVIAIALASVGVIAVIVALVALLSPRDTVATRSTLQVLTHPAGAEVFVQGKRLGSSPLRRDDIGSGKLTLELRKPGFEPLVRTIELAPAQIFQLDVDLSSRRVEEHREALAPAAAPAALPSASDRASDSANDGPQAHADSRPQRASGNGSTDARRRRSDSDHTPRAEPASDDLAELETDHAAPQAPVAPTAEATIAEPGSTNDAPAPEDDGTAARADATPAPAATANPTRAASEERPVPAAPAPAAKAASRAPVVIAQTTPRFPARATRMGIGEGSVTLEFTVERSGAVSQARVVQATPPGVFDDAALRAIEKWRYQPKIDAGKPVDSRLRFTFKFRE